MRVLEVSSFAGQVGRPAGTLTVTLPLLHELGLYVWRGSVEAFASTKAQRRRAV